MADTNWGGERPTLIAVEQPRLAFSRVFDRYFRAPRPTGIDVTAVVDPKAQVGRNVFIGPHCSLGADCVIGDGSVLHAGVRIYPRTRIGCGVTIHAGAVLGAPGFGYERTPEGDLLPFPQLRGVVVEDDVEIGANACVDAGALLDTHLRAGCKLDALCYIAHNVIVGRGSLIMAGARLLGSSRVGDFAEVAPGAVLREHMSVGERSVLGMGAVATRDVPSEAMAYGVPARSHQATPSSAGK